MIEDREPAEVTAEVIADLLYLIPEDKRLGALAIATKAEEAEHEKREKAKPGLPFMTFDKASMEAFMQSPTVRYHNAIMRVKARVICTFVRDITNNHSAEDAGRLLFQHQPNVPSSGYLHEYLDGLVTADKPRFQPPRQKRPVKEESQ